MRVQVGSLLDLAAFVKSNDKYLRDQSSIVHLEQSLLLGNLRVYEDSIDYLAQS